jgi:hypothetical protein
LRCLPVDYATVIPIQQTQTEIQPKQAEELRIREWRFEQFTQLGFDCTRAALMAQTKVDLAQARRLIRLGCPLDTAARILL